MKNSSDAIGNRTRDLLACSTVPQPTAPPRAPKIVLWTIKILLIIRLFNDSPSIPRVIRLLSNGINSVMTRQQKGNDRRRPCHISSPYPGTCLMTHRNPTKHFNEEADATGYFLRQDLSNKRQEWQPLAKDQVVTLYRGAYLKLQAFENSALRNCSGKSYASASFTRHSPAGTENWPENSGIAKIATL